MRRHFSCSVVGVLTKNLHLDFSASFSAEPCMAATDLFIFILEKDEVKVHVLSWSGEEVGYFTAEELELNDGQHDITAIWCGQNSIVHMKVSDTMLNTTQLFSKKVLTIQLIVLVARKMYSRDFVLIALLAYHLQSFSIVKLPHACNYDNGNAW